MGALRVTLGCAVAGWLWGFAVAGSPALALLAASVPFFGGYVACRALTSPRLTGLFWRCSSRLCLRVTGRRYAGQDPARLAEATLAQSEVAKVIQEILDLFVRDFVLYWYDGISDNPAVPAEIRRRLEHIVGNLQRRLFQADATSAVKDVIVAGRRHLVGFDLSRRAAGATRMDMPPPSVADMLARFQQDGGGADHPAADNPAAEENYLQELVNVCLCALAPEDDYESAMARRMFARLLVVKGLIPALNVLMDPTFLYMGIVRALGDSSALNATLAENQAAHTEATTTNASEGAPPPPAGQPVVHGEDMANLAGDDESRDDDLPLPPVDSSASSTSVDDRHSAAEDDQGIQSTDSDDVFFRLAQTSPATQMPTAKRSLSAQFEPMASQEHPKRQSSLTEMPVTGLEPSAHPHFAVDVAYFMPVGRHIEYTIDVWRVDEEADGVEGPAARWVVPRRFREFEQLHNLLKTRYPDTMRAVALPSKRFTFKHNTLDPAFAETRRGLLDRYLQKLLEDAGLGASIEICEFLNPASRIFPKATGRQGVARSVAAIASFGLGTMSRIAKTVGGLATAWRPRSDAPKANARIVFVKRRQANAQRDVTYPFNAHLNQHHEPRRLSVLQPKLKGKSSGDREAPAPDQPDLTPLLVSTALQIFDYEDSWLAHPTPFGTICHLAEGYCETFIEGELAALTTAAKWHRYATLVRDTVWPEGHFFKPSPPYTAEIRELARRMALQTLSRCFPSFLPKLIGPHRFWSGLANILSCLEHGSSNRRLLLYLLDVGVQHLVPELASADTTPARIEKRVAASRAGLCAPKGHARQHSWPFTQSPSRRRQLSTSFVQGLAAQERVADPWQAVR